MTGTFWQATQPVSLVSVPSHPVTNAGTFAVQTTAVPAGTGGFTGSLSVGTASAQLAAAAARTARLAVKNESASASIAVCLGACTAALNTSGSMTIPPGQMLTLSDAAYVPGDAVNAIASSAATPVTVWSK